MTTKQWRLEPEESTFGRIMGSIAKTLRLQSDPDESQAGRWDTGQSRFPDVTVTRPDGKSVVIDTKFDRPSGGRDEWGDAPGKYSRNDQKTDYDEINRQQTGKPKQELSLDADICACPKDKDPEPVEEEDPDYVENPYGMPLVPDVGGLPVRPGVPTPVRPPVPVRPTFEPEFAF